MHLRRVFLWTMIVSLSLAAVLGIVAILVPGFGRTQDRVLITSLLVGAFSLPALACSIVLGRKKVIWLMHLGIGSSLLALTLWLVLVWTNLWHYRPGVDWEEIISKTALPFTVTAALAMHIGLLTLLPLMRPPYRLVRVMTIACASALGGLVLIIIWFEIFEDEMGKALAVLSILTACGTIVTPVLAILDHLQRRGSRESIPSRVSIDLTCPRCGMRQTLPAGTARCAQCRLRIDIDVEEPRCECGYLLYQLQGDTCPECGRILRTPTTAAHGQPSTPPK
ncbi:MAG: hypothetical protein L0219_02655 [Phycisphaerales bacterium]|nr:hypothetical protein [Phycisphaerales bacterium]